MNIRGSDYEGFSIVSLQMRQETRFGTGYGLEVESEAVQPIEAQRRLKPRATMRAQLHKLLPNFEKPQWPSSPIANAISVSRGGEMKEGQTRLWSPHQPTTSCMEIRLPCIFGLYHFPAAPSSFQLQLRLAQQLGETTLSTLKRSCKSGI